MEYSLSVIKCIYVNSTSEWIREVLKKQHVQTSGSFTNTNFNPSAYID